MSVEQSIKIYETDKNGKTYYNIKPKDDLDEGNYVVISKKFEVGKPYFNEKFQKNSYMCIINLGDDEVTLWLSEKQHKLYAVCGGVDDQIKVIKFKNKFLNTKTKTEILYNDIKFELVE